MTSIAVWVGADSRGPASLYVASDSRITWNNSQHWDQGRKVFACSSQPHIFGYWGEVLFPALALPLIVDRIDRGLLSSGKDDWHSEVRQAIRRLWSDYPSGARNYFSIIHGFRTGMRMNSQFHLAITTYNRAIDRWSSRRIPMRQKSALLVSEGSGAKAVRNSYDLWQRSHSAGTSRAVFSAFCESITSHNDQYTGGAPQLAGLYRVGPGRLYGIIHNNQRYFAGAALTGIEHPEAVEWRNHLFERVEGGKKRRLPGAQKHDPRQ